MAWPQNAYVGQKVVYIKDIEIWNPVHQNNPLSIGKTYTITELNYRNELYFAVNGSWLLWLAHSFRPVQSTSTGFSILARLQDPANHRDLDDVSPNSPVLEPAQ